MHLCLKCGYVHLNVSVPSSARDMACLLQEADERPGEAQHHANLQVWQVDQLVK